MATPPEPSMHEYARFYKLSEDYTLLSPASYADESCDPYSLTLHSECSATVDPEKRMKEVDRMFCTGIMMERLPSKPEDLQALNDSLRPKPFKGNVWQGLLPIVKTSDLGPVPVLETFDGYDSPRLSSGFQPHLADSSTPTLSSGIDLADNNIDTATTPETNFPEAGNTLVPSPDLFGSELPIMSPVAIEINTLNHLTVPSETDISTVPPVRSEMFEQPDPDTAYQPPFDWSEMLAEAKRGLREAELLVAEAENMGYDESSLFPPIDVDDSLVEDNHSTPKAQTISSAVSPVATRCEATLTDVNQHIVSSRPSATQAGGQSMAPSTTSPTVRNHTAPSTPDAQLPISAGENSVCGIMISSCAPKGECSSSVNDSSPAASETPSDGLGLGSLSMFMQTRGKNCEGDTLP